MKKYPIDSEPNWIIKDKNCRFAIGKTANDPLVAICMNPSTANEEDSDTTTNRIIGASKKMGKNGWIIFNMYPKIATNPNAIGKDFDKKLLDKNIEVIENYLLENKITEVWGAWGDDNNIKALQEGKQAVLSLLKNKGVKVFYYGTLTKAKNPPHPLRLCKKIDFSNKKYMSIIQVYQTIPQE